MPKYVEQTPTQTSAGNEGIAESRRNSPSLGKGAPVGYPTLIDQPKNTHTCNVRQKVQVELRDVCMCNMYI